MKGGALITPQRLNEELVESGYSEEDAAYAVANCGADWKEIALQLGNEVFANDHGFSTEMVRNTLLKTGFSEEAVRYAASRWTVDEMQEAYERAVAYRKEGKTDQEIDLAMAVIGFTTEQREYALKKLKSN